MNPNVIKKFRIFDLTLDTKASISFDKDEISRHNLVPNIKTLSNDELLKLSQQTVPGHPEKKSWFSLSNVEVYPTADSIPFTTSIYVCYKYVSAEKRWLREKPGEFKYYLPVNEEMMKRFRLSPEAHDYIHKRQGQKNKGQTMFIRLKPQAISPKYWQTVYTTAPYTQYIQYKKIG